MIIFNCQEGYINFSKKISAIRVLHFPYILN